MKTGKRIFYWDAVVFIAWLKGEKCWPQSVIMGMEDVAREVSANRALLFISTLTRTEIFQGTLSKSQKEILTALLQRTSVQEIAPDTRITDRASSIREFYNSRANKIKTPDAIHLATAIIYKADELQTMDGFDPNGQHTKLLALNGDVAGYRLSIVPPYPLRTPPATIVGVKGPLFPEKPVIN